MKKIFSILAIIGFFGVLYYFYHNNPATGKQTYVVCMTKQLSGYDCPGCGGQRALHQVLHGNFLQAAKLNAAIYFFAPLLGYIFFSVVLKPFGIHLPDIDISTKGLWVVLLILLIFTIVRNIV